MYLSGTVHAITMKYIRYRYYIQTNNIHFELLIAGKKYFDYYNDDFFVRKYNNVKRLRE